MNIVTWNVNSIRSREARLARWLKRTNPDVVCLQETKVTDDIFPVEAMESLGYHCAVHGQKTYNGVAILSREPLSNVTTGFGDGMDDSQARAISATTAGVDVLCVYVPNGGKVLTPAYDFKIEWLRRLHMMVARRFDLDGQLAVCGDFNIIPEPRDAHHWPMWSGTVLGSADVRRLFEEFLRLGLVDTFRQHHEDTGHWSWWDYRGRGYDKDEGVRIDFVLASQSLAERCTGVRIDKRERDPRAHSTKPSDHAPVLATFEDLAT